MQIVFHIGAHCTDDDRLVRSLLGNRDVLAQAGVAVPGPGRYRKVLSEALQKLRGAEASAETQDVLLDAVLDDDHAERVVLSNPSFICMASRVLDEGQLYAKAGKSAWLRRAFPGAEVEFALGLRNMASFLPALYDSLNPDMLSAEEFLDGIDPRDLRWSDYIERLQDANPGVPITVWCDEDSPLIWPEILREVAGVDPTVPLGGALDLTRKIMAPEGNKRMRAYLNRRPPANENIRRRVVAAFLSKYALDEAVEQEVDLPGWDEALIDELTELYDEDVDEIARMPGVRVLMP
ncbi:MAG: hypothetical protein KJO78_12300 [Alphaproteobacteria bacterium]|nr:hypothetical protein [Alphaproteobacteria bacterium]